MVDGVDRVDLIHKIKVRLESSGVESSRALELAREWASK